ncbi:MAG TPA: hypothetical protein VFJ07_24185 [Streptosporangiaceae bacterium]|nr:hypothetical protein [Streptosporangiaceae bacterium]
MNGIISGSEWQCVELINRLYITRGWIGATWHGNGGDSSPGLNDSMFDRAPGSLSKQANGSISHVAPGDVVSINGLSLNSSGSIAGTPGAVLWAKDGLSGTWHQEANGVTAYALDG